MEYPVYNQNAEETGKIDLPDLIFNSKMNSDLLHQVVSSLIANQRQTLAHTKSRGEVRGGGRKPWRQKGTGRARHGSIRSPLWKGGGVTFGPTKEKNFKKKINKKMARRALAIALASKTKDGQLLVLDDIKLIQPKTKEMAAVLKSFRKITGGAGTTPSILLITPSLRVDIKRAAQNLPALNVIEARNLNSLSVLSSKYAMLLKDSIDIFQKLFDKS